MRILKIFLPVFFIFTQFGCATWRDINGIEAKGSEINKCEHRCSYYENAQGAYTSKVCFKNCMEEKGYSKTSDW